MHTRLVYGALVVLILGCGGGGEPSPAPAAGGGEAPSAAPQPPVEAVKADPAARPLYYDRALTAADLEGRTLRELALMRNTIFARTGHPFVKPWLNAYFKAQPWYQPKEKGDLGLLTDYDRANVTAITNAESAVSRDELVARRAAIQGRAPSDDDRVELSLISAALGEWSGGDAVPVAQRNPLEDPSVLDKQLTLAQIDGMSRRDLRLLRNTIFARHGRPFQSEVLSLYFSDKAWYRPRDDFKESMLTEVDKRNIKLVQSQEDRLGGPLSEWDHQMEEGWFAGA